MHKRLKSNIVLEYYVPNRKKYFAITIGICYSFVKSHEIVWNIGHFYSYIQFNSFKCIFPCSLDKRIFIVFINIDFNHMPLR